MADNIGYNASKFVDKPIFDFIKRCFDVFASIVSIIVFSPLFLIVAICIKSDGGNVIYKAKRMGKDGEIIDVYKFRSMCMNADNIQLSLSDEDREAYEKEYKLSSDPRITKIGKIIRKTSIDELPQFFNVLKGNMSIVGPRPILEDEADLYGDGKELLFKVKPGITGLWQVSGRNNVTYESGKRQELELRYVAERSLKMDIKILFLTIGTVLGMKGAM